jgi:hypothetical protein
MAALSIACPNVAKGRSCKIRLIDKISGKESVVAIDPISMSLINVFDVSIVSGI